MMMMMMMTTMTMILILNQIYFENTKHMFINCCRIVLVGIDFFQKVPRIHIEICKLPGIWEPHAVTTCMEGFFLTPKSLLTRGKPSFPSDKTKRLIQAFLVLNHLILKQVVKQSFNIYCNTHTNTQLDIFHRSGGADPLKINTRSMQAITNKKNTCIWE